MIGSSFFWIQAMSKKIDWKMNQTMGSILPANGFIKRVKKLPVTPPGMEVECSHLTGMPQWYPKNNRIPPADYLISKRTDRNTRLWTSMDRPLSQNPYDCCQKHTHQKHCSWFQNLKNRAIHTYPLIVKNKKASPYGCIMRRHPTKSTVSPTKGNSWRVKVL